MKEWKIYEPNWEKCIYCILTYEEYDTGYREFGCAYYGNENDFECNGGSLYGCPLAFKYIEEK